MFCFQIDFRNSFVITYSGNVLPSFFQSIRKTEKDREIKKIICVQIDEQIEYIIPSSSSPSSSSFLIRVHC